jgi:hypothetical protein
MLVSDEIRDCDVDTTVQLVRDWDDPRREALSSLLTDAR